MKLSLLLLILVSTSAFAKIELCQRRAQIAWGIFDHYWLKTDTITAGMGSNSVYTEQIGDQRERPFTKVFVVDHSSQIPRKCTEYTNHDEACVNKELEIGKPLGRFTPTNQCLSFVKRILRKCETAEYKLMKKERAEYRQLVWLEERGEYMTDEELNRMDELQKKYNL